MAMDACLNLAILIGVLVMFNPSKFQIAEKPSITLLYCPPDEVWIRPYLSAIANIQLSHVAGIRYNNVSYARQLTLP